VATHGNGFGVQSGLLVGSGVRDTLSMEFRVLGPLEVLSHGRTLELGGQKQRALLAVLLLSRAVTGFGGIALRYGVFYGAANDGTIEPVRKRQFPIVGDGGGVWSWIHLDDAAAATVLALEHDGPAIYNIVDDEPAPVREWLPVLAQALGAKPPQHLPTWLARLLAGDAVTVMSTEARGASNARAKRELGWTPHHPTWRTGFKAVYSTLAVADQPQARPTPQTSHSSR
jgi:nucleoside-diphosphate-sugar epimerase